MGKLFANGKVNGGGDGERLCEGWASGCTGGNLLCNLVFLLPGFRSLLTAGPDVSGISLGRMLEFPADIDERL